MPGEEFFKEVSWGLLFSAPPVFVLIRLKVVDVFANYGKHSLPGMLSLNARVAWFLFELPNIVWSLYSFFHRDRQVFSASPVNAILLSMFVLHYINRCIYYPLRMSRNSKPVNLATFICASLFCFVNGYVQSQSLCQFHTYPSHYWATTNFIIGVALWLSGFIINIHSDLILKQLRDDPPINTYKIPKGGLFSYVSCANFLGEIVEWFGYAIAGNSIATWAFFAWVCANLIPRAVLHHEWYLVHFEDYPKERYAVIPFVF